MKTTYRLLFLLLIPVLFYSCAAPYAVATNVKLKDDWTITSTEVTGDLAGAQITTPVFEDATLQCLNGSKWSFFEGGAGNYTIKSADTTACLKGNRKITWEVIELQKKSHFLQFYRVNAPKGILTDRFTLYIAEITTLTKNSMVLKYPVKINEVTGSIVLTFTKGK